jgi:LuxR family maltose regulon positive regulatory protein
LNAIKMAEQIMENNAVDRWYSGWLDECRVRYWLSNGDLAACASWAERSGLTPTNELSYHYDLHHINLAQVLVAQGLRDSTGPYLEEAENLLDRLLVAAEKAGWIHETIKILILKGLALWVSGKQEDSVGVAIQALKLAEPGGYVRMFVDEGASMEELLSKVLARRTTSGVREKRIYDYTEKLLAAIKNDRGGLSQPAPLHTVIPGEVLSERELEVIRLLNTHLSSTEIAQELNISANTARFHIKNIYSKLNVHRRFEAIQQAKELGIL